MVKAKPAEKEAVFTLIHDAEVDSVFELTSLTMDPPIYGAPANQSIYPLTVQAITGVSGGTDVAFVASGSDSGSLTGKVSLRVLPDSVNSSGISIRNVDCCFSVVAAQSGNGGPALWQNNTAGAISRKSYGNVLFSGYGAVQSMTFGEGEGLAFRFHESTLVGLGTFGSVRASHRRPYSIVIRVGTSCYSCYFEVPTSASGREIFALFNELGSGVTCEILSIEQTSVGHIMTKNSSLPAYGSRGNVGFSLKRIDAVDMGGNCTRQAVTFMKNRGSAPSLDGKLLSYIGENVGNFNPKYSAAADAAMVVAGNDTPEFDSANQFLAWEHTGSFRVVKQRVTHEQSPVPIVESGAGRAILSAEKAPIVLRKGEGIALICTGVTFSGGDVVVHGTLRYVPAVATFPAVGDVDNGIQYGPTGTDYTGTLVQPAEADVESGVSYGAGGTEFTGTLVVGGGGGNTYSRGRVVNS